MAKAKCRCLDPGAKRSGFGSLRVLPSGRHQARYTEPGGATVTAPSTFDTHQDAEAWLTTQRADLVRGAWLPPDSAILFGDYARTWIEHRTLKPRTRGDYRKLLDRLILPTFKTVPVRKLTPALVRDWHARTAVDTPTLRAHGYMLLKTICATAVADDLLIANPCRIRGAGQAKRVSKTEPATLDELAVIVEKVPARYKLMMLLAAWCALRFGELTELRGSDIDTKRGVIKIRRGVTWVDSKPIVVTPKSNAGNRDVNIPPHLLPAVRDHLLRFGVGLLFPAANDPATHMRPATLYRVYYPAREAAGRVDLRFHDLRHYADGGVMRPAGPCRLAAKGFAVSLST